MILKGRSNWTPAKGQEGGFGDEGAHRREADLENNPAAIEP
jgi:hypothetical protein